MPVTAKILTALLALGTIFISIFLIVYFALLGLIFIPLLLGLAFLLFKGIQSSARTSKAAISGDDDSDSSSQA
jgi:hypothetical protein